MIIVEGPDGGGKTTLVEHLARKFDIPIADKVVASDTKPIDTDLKHWTEMNLKKGLQWMIFDRHRLISEPIYATAMGRQVHPGFDDFSWLTARMIDFTRVRPFMIYALPRLSTVLSNLEGDETNEVIFGHATVIYNAYVASAAGNVARGQAVSFDYETDSDFDRIDMLFDTWIRANRSRLALQAKKYF